MQDDDPAGRAARMQSVLRINLSIRDGSANVYWKHDGERFSGLSKRQGKTKAMDWRSRCSGSTLKLCSGATYQLTLTSNRPAAIRPGSGHWDVKEIDSEGRELQPQFQVGLPQPPPPPPPFGMPLPLSMPSSQLTPPPQQPSSSALAAAPPALSLVPERSAGELSADPRALRWTDVSSDAARSTYTAALPCRLEPTEAGRRQYLLIEAYVEGFGLVVCPLQIKVYKPTDKSALSSFPLRFVQFDFREDSSSVGDLFAVNYYKY